MEDNSVYIIPDTNIRRFYITVYQFVYNKLATTKYEVNCSKIISIIILYYVIIIINVNNIAIFNIKYPYIKFSAACS